MRLKREEKQVRGGVVRVSVLLSHAYIHVRVRFLVTCDAPINRTYTLSHSHRHGTMHEADEEAAKN